MAKTKLKKIQDIPRMKIYDGPDGPEMYVTDPRFHKGNDWLELMIEAKMKCRKVKITYIESPEGEEVFSSEHNGSGDDGRHVRRTIFHPIEALFFSLQTDNDMPKCRYN